MAILTSHPADHSATIPGIPPIAGSTKPGAILPEEMTGWHSTREAASIVGITPRQFRHFSGLKKLTKRNIGMAAYYDPQVVKNARRSWLKAKALKAQKELAAQSAELLTLDPSRVVVPALSLRVKSVEEIKDTEDAFYLEALSLLREIVQQRSQSRR